MKPIALVITCEHAVNTVPPEYHHVFTGNNCVLDTHRGLDIGAQYIANQLHQHVKSQYTQASVTRLLIDCNRSLTHHHCFSEFTKHLPEQEKQHLINTYYQPFRDKTMALIQEQITLGKQVLHLSIHSFTPVLNGIARNAGIGLLYDHTRHAEQEVARIWRSIILQKTPTYRVRMNYPYHGKSDGFTTTLRKHHSEHDYLGFEVESNQALLVNQTSCDEITQVLSVSLYDLLMILSP